MQLYKSEKSNVYRRDFHKNNTADVRVYRQTMIHPYVHFRKTHIILPVKSFSAFLTNNLPSGTHDDRLCLDEIGYDMY